METLQVTAVVEDITCQMGAHPKTLVDWATGGGIQLMEKDLLGQVVFPDLLINCSLTTSQESQATILEWTSTGPIDLKPQCGSTRQ